MKKNVIFLDLETRGLKITSVWSLTAIKVSIDLETMEMIKIDEFDRKYYTEYYPRNFVEDESNFYWFCSDTKHFVAHNIKFDRQFFPFPLEIQFDTMQENTEFIRLKGQGEEYKWPKLFECADFYKIPYEKESLHTSYYDTLLMIKVFKEMTKYSQTKKRIQKFLNGTDRKWDWK